MHSGKPNARNAFTITRPQRVTLQRRHHLHRARPPLGEAEGEEEEADLQRSHAHLQKERQLPLPLLLLPPGLCAAEEEERYGDVAAMLLLLSNRWNRLLKSIVAKPPQKPRRQFDLPLP